jgi:hypothetical protein
VKKEIKVFDFLSIINKGMTKRCFKKMLNRKFLFILLAVVITFFIAFIRSGIISNEQALLDFKKDYPKTKVYDQFIGEGDSDHAYMHFRFIDAESKEKKEVMFLYQKKDDGAWNIIYKSKPKSPGSDFGD